MQSPDFCKNLSLNCFGSHIKLPIDFEWAAYVVWLELALGDTCITCLYVLVSLRPLNVALDDGKH